MVAWPRPQLAPALAKLKPYGIAPKTMRINHRNQKGYALSQFTDAFAIPHAPTPIVPADRHTVTNQENQALAENINASQ